VPQNDRCTNIGGMVDERSVNLTPEESKALRTRMRDLQAAVSRFYAATGSGADFEPDLRAFITHTQSINDLLTKSIADKASWSAALDAQGADAKDLLNGIKYVRNVDQHLIYTVAPDSKNVRIVGGTFGMRLFPTWKSIPAEVHAELHPGSRKLQSAFERRLMGREISGTMMDVVRLFGKMIPDAVHRDVKGEWTGFPLLHQPGMGYPLHPEEPLERAQVHEWLSKRVPNGDIRVAMGMRIHDGVKYLYGNTWVGRYSFSPFVETIAQVRADIAAGFTYLACEDMWTLKSANREFPDALQGTVFSSTVDVESHGAPVTESQLTEEWVTPGSEIFWDDVNTEVHKDFPANWYFENRRARRLNALVPPSFTRR
jgi:hypothetical protein